MAVLHKLEWTRVADAPPAPGIYAWYYRPQLTKFDIESAISRVQSKMEGGDEEEAQSIIRNLLEQYLFRFFEEDPFKVSLSGPLKPDFLGQVSRAYKEGGGLVDRLVAEPSRLWAIKELLEESVPEFASPIYIGMSKDLKKRLGKHKKLIETFRSQAIGKWQAPVGTSKASRDRSFAQAVSMRNMVPDRLLVYCRAMKWSREEYLDAEYLLNRLHFPLFGRN